MRSPRPTPCGAIQILQLLRPVARNSLLWMPTCCRESAQLLPCQLLPTRSDTSSCRTFSTCAKSIPCGQIPC